MGLSLGVEVETGAVVPAVSVREEGDLLRNSPVNPLTDSDPPVRVLLADDQRLMLTALRTYVDSDSGLTAVGEAMNGEAAITQVRALQPDVVLMDLRMPIMDGVQATAQIVEEFPQVRVLVLTAFQSNEYVVSALRAGASGYLLKDAEPEEVIRAIRTIHGGGSVVSAAVASILIREVVRDAPRPREMDPDVQRRAALLSARERDVVEVLCRGRGNREIAKTLGMSEATVKTHLSNVMQKLEVHGRLQIAVFALREGLVVPS